MVIAHLAVVGERGSLKDFCMTQGKLENVNKTLAFYVYAHIKRLLIKWNTTYNLKMFIHKRQVGLGAVV